MLDINNIYVSSINHQFNAIDYLNAIPVNIVQEMHLAGFSNYGSYLIDTHSAPVSAEVWGLYAIALKRFGRIPTLIEWDTDIPTLSVLLEEAEQANTLMDKYHVLAA